MVSIEYKKYGLRVNAIWFCPHAHIGRVITRNKADIIVLHGVREKPDGWVIVSPQHTLITDLTIGDEDIFKQINKNFRYEINRAQRDGERFSVYKAGHLKRNPSVLTFFEQEYDRFTKLKGIPNAYNKSAMQGYVENNNVILSRAFIGRENHAQHIYVCDGENARLLYSVSNFRTKGVDRSLVGRANKYLHWKDILYLKRMNYRYLDWGG